MKGDTPPQSLNASQERMKRMVESLQKYMATYADQYGYLDYDDKTLINDVLYGLGRALSRQYEFADGFDKFKAFLRAYLAAETSRSETVTCPLCVPSDDAIEAEIKRLHPHGHYKETPSGMTGQDLLREMARFVLRGVYPLCSRADTSRSAIATKNPPAQDVERAGAQGNQTTATTDRPAGSTPATPAADGLYGDKPEGLPFCRACGSRENEPCPYHTLKSGCPHGVPMVYARSSGLANDPRKQWLDADSEIAHRLWMVSVPGETASQALARVLSSRSATAVSVNPAMIAALREIEARYQGNPSDGLAMAILAKDWINKLSKYVPQGGKDG